MEVEHIVREFREKTENLYGSRLKNIILYGSYVKDRATEDSDIDLVVVLDGDVAPGEEIDRMIDIITELNLNYGILLSVYPVSEKKFNTVDSPLLLNVRKERIPV